MLHGHVNPEMVKLTKLFDIFIWGRCTPGWHKPWGYQKQKHLLSISTVYTMAGTSIILQGYPAKRALSAMRKHGG